MGSGQYIYILNLNFDDLTMAAGVVMRIAHNFQGWITYSVFSTTKK